jgi:hypothetical protein
MDKKSRPLWQLLLLTHSLKNSVQLTCEECFALIEYDAELLSRGVDIEKIHPVASYHLTLCPECWEKFDNWLKNLSREQSCSSSH